MAEEKKTSRYTEAQNRATQKYIKNNYDEVKLRMPKGKKATIKEHASTKGESMNAFVVRAIDETIKRDE